MPQPAGLPKMALGFVIRRCAIALGHEPSAEEFARWANEYTHENGSVRLFGRAISVDEARLILGHRARVVSARGAAPHERSDLDVPPAEMPANVTSFAAARLRLAAKRKP